jgi:hypothetical protein
MRAGVTMFFSAMSVLINAGTASAEKWVFANDLIIVDLDSVRLDASGKKNFSFKVKEMSGVFPGAVNCKTRAFFLTESGKLVQQEEDFDGAKETVRLLCGR